MTQSSPLRDKIPCALAAGNELWVIARHADMREIAADTRYRLRQRGVTVGAHAVP